MIELIIIILIFSLIIGGGGTAYFFNKNNNKKNNNEQDKDVNDKQPKEEEKLKTEINNKHPLNNRNLKKKITTPVSLPASFSSRGSSDQQKTQQTQGAKSNVSGMEQKTQGGGTAVPAKGFTPGKQPSVPVTQGTQKENKQNNVVSSKAKSSKSSNKVIKKKSKKKTGNLIDNEIFKRAFQHIEKEEEDKKLEEAFEKLLENFEKEIKNNKVAKRIREEDKNIYNAIISNAKKIYKAIFLFRNQKFKALYSFFHYFCNHDKNFSKASKDFELLANKLINIISEDSNNVNYHRTVLEVLSNGRAFDLRTEFSEQQLEGEEFFTNEEINKLNDLVGKEKVTIREYDETIECYSNLITEHLLSKNVEIKTEEEKKIVRFFSASILIFYNRHVSEFESFLHQEIVNEYKDLIDTLLEETKNSYNIGNKDIQQVSDSLCKELQLQKLENINLNEHELPVFLEEKLKMNDDSFKKNKIENETRKFFLKKIKDSNFKGKIEEESSTDEYIILDEFIKIIKYSTVMEDMTFEQLYCLLLSNDFRLGNSNSFEDIDYLINLFFKKKTFSDHVFDCLQDDVKGIILSENQKNPPNVDKKNDVEDNLKNIHSLKKNNLNEDMFYL